ncbi:flagellar hook-length control protein FliK [Variovorax sp. TBS-050B]|uniref:flagellar hook-length control protein FliK n=1 Tax=Variovorax sp. TBS-050B TaxID=2940551 RepID=UPI0024771274|nr:flagellar hook-length control protein FliK [Variovorax sp. TBS-050B]MDH6591103.1 flagellar hook-length control protein FliK [Variovorax sp. TBS-050B]
MPTFIAPSFSANAAASPAAAGNGAGPRGRGAEEPDGRSFNAVLNRSRHADGKAPPAEDASATDTIARRKPGRGGDRRDELPAEALPLAFFAPLIANAPARLPAAVSADAPVAATGLPPNGAPIETLAADAAATATSETKAATAPEGEDAAKAGSAQAAANGAAPETAADAGTAAAVQRVAEAPLPATPAAGAGPDATATAAAPAVDGGAAPEAAVAIAGTAAAAPAAAASGHPRDALLSSADDAAADAEPADTAARGAELSTSSSAAPATPAATAVLASHPFMPAAAARANVPPASVHVPTLSVEPSVGSEAWGKAIGQQMLRMSAAGYQVAELNLNPAGLGPLKVTLSLADNQAQAMFVSAHESVRRAVEAALPQLRSSMADSGISLGNASVGAEAHPSPGQGGGFDQQPQQRQQPGSPRPFASPQAVAAADAVQSTPAAAPRRSAAGAVDTFA